MEFDYSKLRGKIREVCNTQADFAKVIGISSNSLSLKLNNLNEFTQNEMKKTVDILNIPIGNIADYFFCSVSSKR